MSSAVGLSPLCPAMETTYSQIPCGTALGLAAGLAFGPTLGLDGGDVVI
jgi:hypothetical protein